MGRPTDAEILDRAKTYPYALPRRSFVFVAGEAHELHGRPGGGLGEVLLASQDGAGSPLTELSGLREGELATKVPVLAYGSNAVPAVLARKAAAPGFPDASPIVVLRAVLHDHDVVFSAHIAAYGAVPATLQVSRATRAHVFLMLLSVEQLAALGATEPNYALVHLSDARVDAEWGTPAPEPQAFLSRHDCLDVGGEEAALAAVTATGRRLLEWTGVQALRFAAGRLAPGRDLDAFVLETVRDPTAPARLTAQLWSSSRPFDGPHRPG